MYGIIQGLMEAARVLLALLGHFAVKSVLSGVTDKTVKETVRADETLQAGVVMSMEHASARLAITEKNVKRYFGPSL